MKPPWPTRPRLKAGWPLAALLGVWALPTPAVAQTSEPSATRPGTGEPEPALDGPYEPSEAPLSEPCGLSIDSPWHLDIAVGTVVPMDLGGRITLLGPGRVFISFGMGVMPDAYVDIINATAEGLDLYHEEKAKLIKDGLHDALTFRSALGWFPWAKYGFYGSVGYAFQGLGGHSSPGAVVQAATDVNPPITGLVDMDVDIEMHVLTVDFGYQWFFARNLFLQAAIGGEFTLAANSHIEPEFGLRRNRLIDRFTQSAEERLDEIVEDNVHHPTVTLLLGARGF